MALPRKIQAALGGFRRPVLRIIPLVSGRVDLANHRAGNGDQLCCSECNGDFGCQGPFELQSPGQARRILPAERLPGTTESSEEIVSPGGTFFGTAVWFRRGGKRR